MTAVGARRAQGAARDERPVLADAPLKPGFDHEVLSRVGDGSWDLGPAVFRETARRCHVAVYFDALGEPAMAMALRELLYARLNVDLIGYRPRLPPVGLRQAFNQARRFFAFVRDAQGGLDFDRVDQALLDRYAKALRAGGVRPVIVGQLLQVIFDLYAYRDHLPLCGLRFEPWPGRSAAAVAGYVHVTGENRTPRIPEPIMAALLAWSLRYVEAFAPDILAARREQGDLLARCEGLIGENAGLSPAERRARRLRRLEKVLESRRGVGRGVPVWSEVHNGARRRDGAGAVTPPINFHLLHLLVGIDAQAEPGEHLALRRQARELLAGAVLELGVEAGGMETPIGFELDTGRPWRPRFDAKALALEERMLQAAAYVVCAYLTGMRDCEVQAMRAGCLSSARSEDGLIERYRVRSVAYKGKTPVGAPAEWVTIAPVGRAIGVLEALSAGPAAARGTDTLWPVLDLAPATKAHVGAEMVRQLNAFRAHLDARFGTEAEPAIPRHMGQPWRFTTRQFRRTIAWHIANRPFGTVAGMIQYKHASVAAFEGYAGSSRSGFRAEVEAQRRLGQLDDVLVYFDERRAGRRLSGPAAARVGQALDAAAETLEPLPAMIADRGRLRTVLASTARTLHPGLLADCFFDPSTALCLRPAEAGERSGPMISLCQPTRCPNACITIHHRPAWARAVDEVCALLSEKRLGSLQRTVLEQERERLRSVLRAIDPKDSGA